MTTLPTTGPARTVQAPPEPAALPLAPKNPMPYRQRLAAVKHFHTGTEKLRDAGGPVTRIVLGPRRLMPPIVLATSPQAIGDILSIKDGTVDKTSPVFDELRAILGTNLVNLRHRDWQPRRRTIAPVFTRSRVGRFAGHITEATETVCRRWATGTGSVEIDLDAACRAITLQALGRSVLGLDLDDGPGEDLGARAAVVADPLSVALNYAMRRALRPVRAPRWLPTPARRRARAASAELHRLAAEILRACREDPDRDAPLVQALIAASDPVTGEPLSDREICNELIIFMFAGHDTVATTLTYALWELGRHPAHQARVAAEVNGLGDRPLTTADLPRLEYTHQVVKEALRLCPPAPTGTRMATTDLVVGGYRVEAGTMLAFGRKAVQQDPALWDDPMTFDPDRFAPHRSGGRDRYQYLPFGGGPRSCIGDHFAMMEATLALATFVRRITVESREDSFPLTVHFTMVADGPVPATVAARESTGLELAS